MTVPVSRLAADAARRPARLAALGAAAMIALTACSPAAPTPPDSPAPPSPAPTSVPSVPTSPSVVPTSIPSPSVVPSSVPSRVPSQAASLLLEVRHEGGFINPAATIGALSTVVVDTDGHIYLPATSPDGSSPMIPPIRVRDTGSSGAAAILEAARAAGLADGTGGGGVVADAGSIVFTLELDGTQVVTRVGAGGLVGGPSIHPGASGDASAAPGAAALGFLSKLTNLTTSWGSTAAPATDFAPVAYRVWVAPESAGGTGSASAAWPLQVDPNTFGSLVASNFGVDGLRSGLVFGADAVTWARALTPVTAGSDLSYAGHAYRVWVRPVLPDELGT